MVVCRLSLSFSLLCLWHSHPPYLPQKPSKESYLFEREEKICRASVESSDYKVMRAFLKKFVIEWLRLIHHRAIQKSFIPVTRERFWVLSRKLKMQMLHDC